MLFGSVPEQIYGPVGLEGTREDLVNMLSIVFGKQQAETKVAEIESLVRQRAAQGTVEALQQKMPEIRQQVRSEASKLVTPLFIGLTVASGIAILVGIVALSAGPRR